jgi:hypothetical protein
MTINDIIYAVRSVFTKSIILKHRGGTAEEHSTFIGAPREITVDTTNWRPILNDGETQGGIPLAKKSEVDNAVSKTEELKTDFTSYKSSTTAILNEQGQKILQHDDAIENIIQNGLGGAGGEGGTTAYVPTKATDAEIASGANVDKYINPKQLKDAITKNDIAATGVPVGSLIEVCVYPTQAEINNAPAYYIKVTGTTSSSYRYSIVGSKALKAKKRGDIINGSELKPVYVYQTFEYVVATTTISQYTVSKGVAIEVDDNFILPANGTYKLLGKSSCEYFMDGVSGSSGGLWSGGQPKEPTLQYVPQTVTLAQRIS